MSDDLELTVEITRGGDTSNRDKWRAKVTASTVDELDERVSEIRERFEQWALEFREIQPRTDRRLSEDQERLADVEA